MRRSTAALAGLALLVGACDSGGVEGAGYNVVLISLDSTRRDLLGSYGRIPAHAPERSTSPNLDRLAAEGARMLDAYSTTSWTLPSHVSMLTGQPELVHGVEIDWLSLDQSRPTLAEILKRSGYRTAGFFSGPYLDPRFGFGRGFDRYEASYGADLARAAEELELALEELARAEDGGSADEIRAARGARRRAGLEMEKLSHRDVSAASIVAAACEELERAAEEDEPLFLFAHFFDPHYDYAPPDAHRDAFDPDYTGDVDGRDFYTNPAISELAPDEPSGRRRTISDRDLEHIRALYEGELAWTDEQIGILLAKLDELGLTEKTLVIVTADHGDEFFEHGGIGHRRTLYEEVLRVPLILRLPGVLRPGAEVEGLVSVADLLPTVLDILRIPAPRDLASSSLLPLIDGDGDFPDDALTERGILARLVTSRFGELNVGQAKIPVQVFVLQETFRSGSIKVTREVTWPEPQQGVAPELQRIVAAEREKMRADERLVWIDLDRHPGEPAEEHSSDFTDPRARAALDAFRARYRELLQLRNVIEQRDTEDDTLEALRGLGYTEGPEAPAAAGDIFKLGPPGRNE